jgi:hypothetical protein
MDFDHSNWSWGDKIRATDEDNVEKVLDRLFSMFGEPEVYKTHNGSPFQSHLFKAYVFEHTRVKLL